MEVDKLTNCEGKLAGQQVTGLTDTGANRSLLYSSLILEDACTGLKRRTKGYNGRIKLRLAKVWMETNGQEALLKVGAEEDLLFDMILGRDWKGQMELLLKYENPEEDIAQAVVTRNQQKGKEKQIEENLLAEKKIQETLTSGLNVSTNKSSGLPNFTDDLFLPKKEHAHRVTLKEKKELYRKTSSF